MGIVETWSFELLNVENLMARKIRANACVKFGSEKDVSGDSKYIYEKTKNVSK